MPVSRHGNQGLQSNASSLEVYSRSANTSTKFNNFRVTDTEVKPITDHSNSSHHLPLWLEDILHINDISRNIDIRMCKHWNIRQALEMSCLSLYGWKPWR